jgi:hypothetical protein
MKKQALKAVTMLVSIITLAFMTAVVSNAQSGAQKLRANIPFDFAVGDKTLAAGEYVVGQISTQDNSATAVRSLSGGSSAINLTSTVQANAPRNRGMLMFHRVGSSYYLAQIWTPGSAQGREILKGKAEKSAERELAKNASRGELAKNSEMIRIYAELR